MKAGFIVFTCLYVHTIVVAQKTNYELALDYTKNYEHRGPDYGKAKEHIDKASAEKGQQKDAGFWLNKGKIYNTYYLNIQKYSTEEEVDQVLSFFQNYLEMDPSKARIKEMIYECQLARKVLINEGVAHFNSEKLQQSYDSYILGMKFSDFINEPDGIGAFYAAAAADHLENFENAIKWYEVSESLGNRTLECCMSVMRIFKLQGNEVGYREKIKHCQEKHPDNRTLLLLEVNRSYEEGEIQKGINLLNNALIDLEDDSEVHYTLGIGYDLNAQPDMAEKHYYRAIELRPGYFDALYNLGTHYFNFASKLSREMEGISDPDIYIKKKKELDSWLEKALVYFEKANAIWDTEMATLAALEQIYDRLNMLRKRRETTAKIELLKSKGHE